MRFIADENTTALLARVLAAAARPGLTILLDGPVGAGKTHFARAFVQARQGDQAEDVPSPTFTLVQTYIDAVGTEIWHADLYRLSDPSELVELGLDEAFGKAICLIEWPERLESLPEDILTVAFTNHGDPALREISLTGSMDVVRIVNRTQFIAAAGWNTAAIVSLAGDASARQYFRLSRAGLTTVLMDDPTDSTDRFLAMTNWLRDAGFGAPGVLAENADAGFLLVEDLGDDLVARVLDARPDLGETIYERITDLLLDLHQRELPDFVPLLNGPVLADQVGLFAEWFPHAVGNSPDQAERIGPMIAELYDKLTKSSRDVVALRDFHAENLIWRGDAPLGLIDYQDAVACHPAYDLVSVLQDARHEVSADLEAHCISRYLNHTGQDAQLFRSVYALVGVQRNLRIIGIFTRLCVRDGKSRYLAFIPRVWGYIQRNLTDPALAPLADIVRDVPAPDAGRIERIRSQCFRH